MVTISPITLKSLPSGYVKPVQAKLHPTREFWLLKISPGKAHRSQQLEWVDSNLYQCKSALICEGRLGLGRELGYNVDWHCQSHPPPVLNLTTLPHLLPPPQL